MTYSDDIWLILAPIEADKLIQDQSQTVIHRSYKCHYKEAEMIYFVPISQQTMT